MSLKLVLLSLVLSIVAVMGQTPKPCETPSLWTADHFQHDHERNEESHGKIYYDAVYKRVRTVSELHEGQEESAYDIVRLFAQRVEYVYDFKTQKCVKQPLSREWRDFGIPDNAKSVGESYIGSSGVANAGLLTTIWEDEFKDSRGRTMYWIGHWTYEACLPVELELYERGTLFHKGLSSHDRFYNILPGISPEAFNLRKECQGL